MKHSLEVNFLVGESFVGIKISWECPPNKDLSFQNAPSAGMMSSLTSVEPEWVILVTSQDPGLTIQCNFLPNQLATVIKEVDLL